MTANQVRKTDYVRLNIRYWREERRWTTRQLGDKIGQTHTSITYMENGQRAIKIEILAKIADALQVPIDKFLEKPPALHSGELPYDEEPATQDGAQ